MVGVGPNPERESALARVSIVNYNGDQIYDSYVKPKELVTDWRTPVSGISPTNMSTARSFEQVQSDIAGILAGNILVGHAVRNDLDALLLSHPKRDIRDTARHPPFRKLAGGSSPRLKILAAELLGLEIQTGAHSSVEDGRATMLLFRKEKEAFEREHAKKWGPGNGAGQKAQGQVQGKKRRKSKRS
jgi:RNA exonuclease 4